ncbi:MAG: hypothetical protein HY907_01510 [Deltaproteobacteria bacterium]|nr:hypothetical protein [Deltaproteobacteria bacterium]
MRKAAAGVMVVGGLWIVAAGCDDFAAFAGRAEVGSESRTLGAVVFQTATTADPQGISPAGERLAIEARFVRYDPPYEAEVREVLGLADLDALPPADDCTAALRVPAAAPAIDPAATTTAGVEFLDVGRILARGGGSEELLAVRTFPDLLDVMSGVTYGGTSGLAYRPGSRYDVRGEADRSPWFSIGAPPSWADLRVGGDEVRDGLVGMFDPEPRLDLRWIPWPDHASDIVVSLVWTGVDGEPRGIVCHPADDGEFDFPTAALIQLPPAPDLAGLTLRIERIAGLSFPLDGIDEAEAVFRVSLTTPIR